MKKRFISSSLVVFLFLCVPVWTLAADDASGESPVIVGVASSVHLNAFKADEQMGGQVLLAGLFWRIPISHWLQVGQSLMAGSGVGQVGSGLQSLRADVASLIFIVNGKGDIQPTVRLGVGWQAEALDRKTADELSRKGEQLEVGNGFFGVIAPGLAWYPLSWLRIHLEGEATLAEEGASQGGPTLQVGGQIGLGFSL